jgi:hypothetical protein
MSPRSKRGELKKCPYADCGAQNEPTNTRCVSCHRAI